MCLDVRARRATDSISRQANGRTLRSVVKRCLASAAVRFFTMASAAVASTLASSAWRGGWRAWM